MSRLTLRLPETLHRQLETLANYEEGSLNQYIGYTAYTIQTLPEKIIAQEKVAYVALLQSLGQASFDEINQAMMAREQVEAENGLTPEIVKAIQSRIAQSQPGG